MATYMHTVTDIIDLYYFSNQQFWST